MGIEITATETQPCSTCAAGHLCKSLGAADAQSSTPELTGREVLKMKLIKSDETLCNFKLSIINSLLKCVEKNIKLCRFLRERNSQGFNLHYSTILYPLMTMKGELRSAAASLYKQASGRHWEAHIMSTAAAVRAPRGHSSASDVNILRLACFWWPSRDSRAVFKSRQILTHLYFKWSESCLESIRESMQLKTGFRVAQVRPEAC